MLKTICRALGCNKTVEYPNHYCPEHSYMEADKKDFFTAVNDYSPSYTNLYKTKRWKELEREHLRKEPYCVICGCKENLVCDHRQAHRGNLDLFFDPDNLQTLCKSCHDQKTRDEIKQRQKEDYRRRELKRRYKTSW